jgi:hypothetical protein
MHRYATHGVRSPWPAKALATLLATGWLGSSHAQHPDWNVPIRSVPAPVDRGTTTECVNDSCNGERRSASPVFILDAASGLGAELIEFKQAPLPGVNERAHHGLGFRSTAMETWVREAGFAPGTCQAPILRMHSKVSSSTGFNGTAWVYARCALR